MKRNIVFFILTLALAELLIAFAFENNSDLMHIIKSDAETRGAVEEHRTPRRTREVKEANDYYLYNVCLDVSCIADDEAEKSHSLAFFEILKTAMSEAGFTLGTTNPDLPSTERATKASKYDIAISVSADGGYDYDIDNNFSKSISVYANPNWEGYAKSRKLGNLIADSTRLKLSTSYGNREISATLESEAYPFLNYSTTPAVVVVFGWAKEEPELLSDEEYLRSVARGITEGVKRFADEYPKKSNGDIKVSEKPENESGDDGSYSAE